jgi:DNA-binding FrmR family transcriptional regulator
MLEDQGPAEDALLQIAAARGALGKTGLLLLDAHVEQALREAATRHEATAREAALQQVMEVFSRYRGIGAG